MKHSTKEAGMMVMRRRASIPARINIVGEHTDYMGGLALPFASQLRLTLTATSSEATTGDSTVVALWEAAGGWPAHLHVESEIPIGAGMSSSAALCLAVVLCARGSIDSMDACLEAQRIEQTVLETPCGLLDQMAMMHAQRGRTTLIDFSSNEIESHPLPADWHFKLIDSGVRRKLGETDFGRSAGDSVLQAHALKENQRVKAALRAKAPELGVLLNESHASLIGIGVSHPDVDGLVTQLQTTPGVLGARMMGGGFGGMILVLVDHPNALPEHPLVVASQGGFLEEFLE